MRWKIVADETRFAITGLWHEWNEPDGRAVSFTMLAVNSDEHPLMRRFHKPGDEKRSVVIVRPSNYEGWLASSSMDEARSYLDLYPADEMRAVECRAPARKKDNDPGLDCLR
ncbi:MAG TPA: SOS response-associated peptidase family protein [Paraburkholderia sp.]|uniref:SOS response-associated peptidase family protein n=1 Tax=Paraburkholderia sp. TaxID=1926495 RepID=UPI002B48C082|nr:SOS response-associated peptidase family protein [Paraburkholderia sp.]HKR43352.1 SOS response-associated peptidase family protein [Paraburkholderia sp.]